MILLLPSYLYIKPLYHTLSKAFDIFKNKERIEANEIVLGISLFIYYRSVGIKNNLF